MREVLRVKDWTRIYEVNRTRELKHMMWVPLPNRMDGEGYTDLLDHPDGAAHFGAWVAILEIASRCDVRGTLLRGAGEPHDSASLARISRVPSPVFDAVIPRLLKIGWLELCDSNGKTCKIPHPPAGIPHPPAGIPHPPATIQVVQEESRRNGVEADGSTAPLKPTEKYKTDEEATGWVRDTLLGFVADIPGWNLPPPDDALCQRVMAIVGKEHLPVIGQALRELHRKGKRPANSWGWFPAVLEEWLKPRGLERTSLRTLEGVMA